MWGAGFAGAKIGAGFAAWYYFNEWDYNRSLYNAARKGNRTLDPNHELKFRLPDGTYRTVNQLKRDSDASAQNVTITMAVNLTIYAVSLLVNYQAVSEFNEESAPSFHADYSSLPEKGEKTMKVGIMFHL